MHFITSCNNGCFLKKWPLLFLVLSTVLVQCSKTESHIDYEVLFTVDDEERTVFDFESQYVKHLIATGRNDSKPERYAYLNKLIDQILLANASKAEGYLDHPTYLSAINFQQRKSMMDTYFVDEMNKVLEAPTDSALRLAYDKKQRKVYVRQLFSLDENEIEAAYQKLESGLNFVDVANDFFNTPEYDSLAGYLGPISYFGVDDAFGEAAFSTNQGEYTKPIRSRFGYHIIYVEYIEFPAMLAEDDYQYRKQGITSQLRLRNQKIVSDEYIRDLMGTLNVQAQRDNLEILKNAILNLDGNLISANIQDEETTIRNWDDNRLRELRAALPEDLILTTYVLGGEKVNFTFNDYLNWLPYLSFTESKNRTGASVGRALRNEVLYKIADKNGYARDERVLNRVRTRGYEILSELYQYDMTLNALRDTSSVIVPETFRERLVNNREFILKAGYWKVPATDLPTAKTLQQQMAEGALPNTFNGYTVYEYQQIEPSNADYDLIRRSLINEPIIGYSGQNGWMIINVNEREFIEISNSTSVSDVETRYRVYSTIRTELEDLRARATIEVDTTLFNQVFDVFKLKQQAQE
jgi:hypothetical protein